MPELPEVETIRRQLEPELLGRRIESVRVLDARWTRPVAPSQVEGGSAGRRIEAVSRRGKYLLLGLEGGRWLVMHLRMTGNLALAEGDDERPHLRARITLDDGRHLLFTDVRRFGTGVVIEDEQLERYLLPRAGIEPLSEGLTAESLERLAAGRRAGDQRTGSRRSRAGEFIPTNRSRFNKGHEFIKCLLGLLPADQVFNHHCTVTLDGGGDILWGCGCG